MSLSLYFSAAVLHIIAIVKNCMLNKLTKAWIHKKCTYTLILYILLFFILLETGIYPTLSEFPIVRECSVHLLTFSDASFKMCPLLPPSQQILQYIEPPLVVLQYFEPPLVILHYIEPPLVALQCIEPPLMILQYTETPLV